ncbi:MAG TPA: thioredoxin family protein [Terriglobales bacterium]|nr:thioredoxin family protein [Terriglobales bacterium]
MLRACVLACLALLGMVGCDSQIQQTHNSSLGLKLGEAAPRVHTKTLADVGGDISRITTYRQPDERMYQYSVDQALATGKPVLLEFATPAHCTPCDRQLQMIKSLLDKYQGRMIFLHMDQYDNPEAYKAFRVPGDPWTFVIDNRGVVRFEQAGSMLYGELERAIQSAL